MVNVLITGDWLRDEHLTQAKPIGIGTREVALPDKELFAVAAIFFSVESNEAQHQTNEEIEGVGGC